MNRRILVITFLLVACFWLLLSSLPGLAAVWEPGPTATATPNPAATPTPSPTPAPTPLPTPFEAQPARLQVDLEREISQRDQDNNGIMVGGPKVYDDALLQQMLADAEAQLATLKLIDQGKILERLGTTSGGSLDSSSIGLSVQTPSLPEIQTTVKNADGTVGGANKTVDLVTKNPQFGPPTATAPTPSQTLSSSGGVSASNTLAEQMQLTFEVANLRLLLKGSLTDFFATTDFRPTAAVKTRTTLGFPVTLSPDMRHKNAVAIVEIEIENITDHRPGSEPGVVAILPREKTYNVASISDKSLSLGGGVATQIVGVSGSWLRGRKTYYLVQDQDTVALRFRPTVSGRVGVRWQFRPVLGRAFVKAESKEVSAQIAFAVEHSERYLGRVWIRTYWRRYDTKKGVLKEILPKSLIESAVPFNVPDYSVLPPASFEFNDRTLEDLGDGRMVINLPRRFLPGTQIRVGRRYITGSSDVSKFNYSSIWFISSISELAAKKVAVVDNDGTENPLPLMHQLVPGIPILRVSAPRIERLVVESIDEANSRVTAVLAPCKGELRYESLDLRELGAQYLGANAVPKCQYSNLRPRLIMVIGGKVFGYADAPVRMNAGDAHGNGATITAVVPNSLLVANRNVTVTSLFADDYFVGEAENPLFNESSQATRLILVKQGDPAQFLLVGGQMANLAVLEPKLRLGSIGGNTENDDTVRTLELTADQLKSYKLLILQRAGGRPFTIPIPTVESKEAKPAEPKPAERITVNADAITIDGIEFKDIASATVNGEKVVPVALKGKSVKITGLRKAGATATATTQSIDFVFKDDSKGSVKFEIVDSKVESIPR